MTKPFRTVAEYIGAGVAIVLMAIAWAGMGILVMIFEDKAEGD